MPGFDGTGPAGRGPMTGWGRGMCNPYGSRAVGGDPYRPAYRMPADTGYGYGFGRPRLGLGRGLRGRGRGLGRGRGPGQGRGWWR